MGTNRPYFLPYIENSSFSWGNQQVLANIQIDQVLKNRILIFNAKNTESFPALKSPLDFIYITNPPPNGSLLNELFRKNYEALKSEGSLCLIISKKITGNGEEENGTLVSPEALKLETLIYYAMRNGFLFLDNWRRKSNSGKRHLSYIWFLRTNMDETF